MIEQYLDRHHIMAGQVEHLPVYTAHQLAELEHIPDKMVAKVVFFFLDDRMVMGVLPANRNLNLHRIKHYTQARYVRLATEREIAEQVKGVELGAVPPFGSLYGLPVLMDQAFMDTQQMFVPGGRLTQSLTLRMEDYLREESPQVAPLSRKPIHHAPRPNRADYESYLDF
jgi:Ala-tRNA(Pro) deacylase